MANKWNQAKRGNVHVSDGAEGFWASMPGATAKQALDEFLSTADYSNATRAFRVTAEVLSGKHEGDVASVMYDPNLYERKDGIVVEKGDWIATRGLTADDSDYGVVQNIEGDVARIGWEASMVVTTMPLSDERHYRVFESKSGAKAFYRDQIEED